MINIIYTHKCRGGAQLLPFFFGNDNFPVGADSISARARNGYVNCNGFALSVRGSDGTFVPD